MIDVSIRLLRADAHVPHQAYDGDAGLDLTACESVVLGPGERAVVPTGIAVEIPEGYAGFVQPRSGLAARHGIGIVNAPGLIDSGYRGEIRVVLLNTDRETPFMVEPGMRIAQLVIAPVAAVRLLEVDELATSERGAPRIRLVVELGRWASRGSVSPPSFAGKDGFSLSVTTRRKGRCGSSRAAA